MIKKVTHHYRGYFSITLFIKKVSKDLFKVKHLKEKLKGNKGLFHQKPEMYLRYFVVYSHSQQFQLKWLV